MFLKEPKFYVDDELRKKLSYQNLENGHYLKETRGLLIKELEENTRPKDHFKRKNLQGWLEKYEKAILDFNKTGRYIGKLKDRVKEIINLEGFKDLNIEPSELDINHVIRGINQSKDTQLRFDLIGKDHIFYIEAESCRVRPIAQIIASRQYFLETEGKEHTYVVIAREFGQQFLLALRGIEPLGIDLYLYKYYFDSKGINYSKFIA